MGAEHRTASCKVGPGLKLPAPATTGEAVMMEEAKGAVGREIQGMNSWEVRTAGVKLTPGGTPVRKRWAEWLSPR